LLGALLGGGATWAQSGRSDSLAAFRPLAAMARLYQHSTVLLDLHLRQDARPVTNASDTLETDMEVYYGKPDEYVRAEGLEEIVNDSVVLLVNSPAKRMLRFNNTPEVQRKLNRSAFLWMPDSSLAELSKRYKAMLTEAGEGKNKLVLIHREVVYGTQLPREVIEIIYRSPNSEPVQCTHTRVSLVPVDSSVYIELQKQERYKGSLLTISVQRGRLFFIVKELTTVCYFRKVELAVKRPPVREGDRVVSTSEGGYRPAQGFEDYLLTQENE
jgi:hypothetical protein